MKEVNFYSEKTITDISKNSDDEFIQLIANKYLNKEILIKPMFTVPILHIKMSNWNSKKEELLNLYNSGKDWVYFRNTLNTTYFSTEDFLDKNKTLNEDTIRKYDQWTKELTESINNVLKEERKIIYEMFGDPEKFPQKTAEIDYCWFQEQKNGMFHGPHTHGCSGLSAVCFINYDEKFHAPTEFLSPYFNPSKGNNEQYVEKNVSSGSLLVFPSNIIHYTNPTDVEKSRLILSFNASL